MSTPMPAELLGYEDSRNVTERNLRSFGKVADPDPAIEVRSTGASKETGDDRSRDMLRVSTAGRRKDPLSTLCEET